MNRREAAAALLAAETEIRRAQRDHDGSEAARARYRAAVFQWRLAEAMAAKAAGVGWYVELVR